MKGIMRDYNFYVKFFLMILLLTFISACNGVTTTSPVINSFTADVTTIIEGESATLSWQVTDATSINISPTVGDVSTTPTGTSTVSPTSTTTYTLTATNSAGSTTANVIITVGTGMDEAIKVVVEEVLPEIPEVQSGDPYVCLKLASSLPPGTVIEEDAPLTPKAV